MTVVPLIQQLSLTQLSEELRSGKRSLAAMLDDVQERFSAIEPRIQSFVHEEDQFERLRAEAQALEERYPDPARRPPLYGVLVGIKDIFHVDGLITRAGTALPPDLFAGDEAVVVSKLKQAGALIAGKTVTTEFAYFEPGPTRNPHNPGHTPGGSSSGSAAAVAAGLVALATGTQTVGSVIRPAAYCGIVGYKPSYDRIDTPGTVYYSRSVDHVGLFTQDVAGMALAASVLVNDWDRHIAAGAKPVLGIPEGAYLQQAEMLPAFEAQVAQLEAVGYPTKRVRVLDDIEAIDRHHQNLIAAELAQEHAPWFYQYESLYRDRTSAKIRLGQAVSAADLEAARENCLLLRQNLQEKMATEGIDLWICPPAPGTAPEGIASTGSPAMNLPWTHAGMPTLSIPAGTGEKGLPLGLQLIARFNADEQLIAWSAMLESVLAVRAD